MLGSIMTKNILKICAIPALGKYLSQKRGKNVQGKRNRNSIISILSLAVEALRAGVHHTRLFCKRALHKETSLATEFYTQKR